MANVSGATGRSSSYVHRYLGPDRCTPEYERILVKMGSFATYGRAGALMAEFLPLDKAPGVETHADVHGPQIGASLERQMLTAKPLVTRHRLSRSRCRSMEAM